MGNLDEEVNIKEWQVANNKVAEKHTKTEWWMAARKH